MSILESIVGPASLIVISFIWLLLLPKNKYQIHLSSFGPEKNAKKAFELMEFIFRQYAKQQKWAFGLLWFTIAWALLLGSYFIMSIFQHQYGIKLLAKGIALAGGTGISFSAFRFYNKASKRTDDLIKNFAKKL